MKVHKKPIIHTTTNQTLKIILHQITKTIQHQTAIHLQNRKRTKAKTTLLLYRKTITVSLIKKIGVYETKNLPSVSNYYDDRCPAWISVYSVGKNAKTENEIKEKFNTAFGYYANENVVCTYVGKYIIDGYNEAEEIYQYTIQDLTYPLLQDELYVITKQLCDDGSAWVGFPVPGTLYTMDTSDRVSELINEMDKMFCEWTGYDMKYMRSHKDKFMIDMISVAGKMRTTDGKVIDVVYRYTRGVDMPVNN